MWFLYTTCDFSTRHSPTTQNFSDLQMSESQLFTISSSQHLPHSCISQHKPHFKQHQKKENCGDSSFEIERGDVSNNEKGKNAYAEKVNNPEGKEGEVVGQKKRQGAWSKKRPTPLPLPLGNHESLPQAGFSFLISHKRARYPPEGILWETNAPSIKTSISMNEWNVKIEIIKWMLCTVDKGMNEINVATYMKVHRVFKKFCFF